AVARQAFGDRLGPFEVRWHVELERIRRGRSPTCASLDAVAEKQCTAEDAVVADLQVVLPCRERPSRMDAAVAERIRRVVPEAQRLLAVRDRRPSRSPEAAVKDAAQPGSLVVVLDAPDFPADYRLCLLGEQVNAASEVHCRYLDIRWISRRQTEKPEAGLEPTTRGLQNRCSTN